ncbi:hypothetical protein DVS28_b0066 (plasmid) [Euzebya pacifica]|uniref:Uncharacterized protein n=1 Tax=Euzebya pacifica TaxID=1608957 RepID=A0A346Y5T9_9ACTN|nr:hypothetical protein [Euzebya pacifica]AXV09836.1 hypothetical protein DVS28_b0066 [Euzebya pacifica]
MNPSRALAGAIAASGTQPDAPVTLTRSIAVGLAAILTELRDAADRMHDASAAASHHDDGLSAARQAYRIIRPDLTLD